MRCQLASVLIGGLLMVAPGNVNAAPRGERTDSLMQIATGIGRVSGAASVCREISWQDIKAVTEKFNDLVRASVPDSDEFTSIQQAYDQSSIDSQRNVTSRPTDCAAAVSDLADLQRAVTSKPPQAAGSGVSQAQAAIPASPQPATTGTALRDARGRRNR